jgi:hypothetical protein
VTEVTVTVDGPTCTPTPAPAESAPTLEATRPASPPSSPGNRSPGSPRSPRPAGDAPLNPDDIPAVIRANLRSLPIKRVSLLLTRAEAGFLAFGQLGPQGLSRHAPANIYRRDDRMFGNVCQACLTRLTLRQVDVFIPGVHTHGSIVVRHGPRFDPQGIEVIQHVCHKIRTHTSAEPQGSSAEPSQESPAEPSAGIMVER